MQVTKLITLFSLISLSTCASFSGNDSDSEDSSEEPGTSTIHPAPQTQNYGLFRRSNSFNKNLRQCFCYLQKQTGIPITQILSSGGENLDRLVVYLYKDPATDEINLFLPNNEKQIMIPDLAFDEGDHLEISSSENVHHIFNKFPDLITKRKRNEIPDIAQIIIPDKLNKKLNNPAINTLDPISIHEVFNIHKEHQIKPKKTVTYNNVIKQVKAKPPVFVNNDHQLLIETATDRPNSLHLIPLHINNSEEKIESVPDIPSSNTFTENLSIIDVANIDLSKEDINVSNELEIEETGDDENKPNVIIDETITFNNNAPSNIDNIVEIDTEQPSIYEEPIPLQDIIEIRPDEHQEIHLPIVKDINFMELPFISNSVSEDPSSLINMYNYVKPGQLEQPEEDLKDPNLNLYEYINSEIKNYLQPDISNDQKFEPIQLYNQNEGQSEKHSHYNNKWLKLPDIEVPDANSVNNYVQNPFISNIIKKGEHSLQIPLTVNENVITGEHKWTLNPVEYINKELTHEQHVSPQDISIIAMHPETLVKKHQDTNEYDVRDTFDNWFNKQIQRVQFTNSRASNFLDIYTFKYLIEKALREKGMHITQEGLIIDSQGNVLQTSNLGLRPILIGNSVEYKNLLQGKFSTFKLPTDLPYLEAVLITSFNPPKILGIIPLGKTYLPKSYQNSLSLYVGDNGTPKNICGGRCNHQGSMITPSVNTKRTGGHYGYKIHQPKMTNIEYSHRIFPFDQINTIIDKIYKVPISKEKIVNVPQHYILDTQPVISRKPVIKKYPANVAKVLPGFRIIGGNAATSSGTPLNNKGRSGYDSLETYMDSDDQEI